MKDVMKFAYYLIARRAPNIKVVPGVKSDPKGSKPGGF